MSTMDNLIKAFEGESWAIRKYHAYLSNRCIFNV
jgi:rubrerythrin